VVAYADGVPAPALPFSVLVEFTHADVQAIAADHGVDLLHIKGHALDPTLRRPWPDASTGELRTSIDADVLVRPSHVNRFAAALNAQGWRRLFDFADGSAFEHAATWGLDGLASLDVHRYFPGIEIDPEQAFDILWSARESIQIAGITCPVPSLTAQRLIVVIHAARGRSRRDAADRGRAWESLSDSEREEIDQLAERLGARVALYAGTGRLASVRGERTYPLWRHLTEGGGSRLDLWWSRVVSAPDTRSAIRIGARMILPNTRRMETHLGRPPTGREIARAYAARVALGVRTIRRSLARRGQR